MRATEYCKMDPRGSRVASDNLFQEDISDDVCTIHTAESVVTMCVDDSILDSSGKSTGVWYIAGPYCPELSLRQICLPNYEREPVGTAVAKDEIYRMATVESYGTCTVHSTPPNTGTQQPEGGTNDPLDPNHPLDPIDPLNPVDPNTGIGGDAVIPASQDIRSPR